MTVGGRTGGGGFSPPYNLGSQNTTHILGLDHYLSRNILRNQGYTVSAPDHEMFPIQLENLPPKSETLAPFTASTGVWFTCSSYFSA